MTQFILNGDCLELMKGMPDKSVDLFVCDLPYGCLTNQPKADGTEGKSKGGLHHAAGGGKERAKRRANTETAGMFGCSWDIKLDLNAFWTQVKRLCKDDHTPVLMFCNTKFGFDLYNSNPDWFRYDLVWNKMRGVSFLSANKMPMRSHEMVYVFSKKGANYYRKDIDGDFKKVGGGRNTAASLSQQYGSIPLTGIPENEGKRCALSVINNGTSMRKGGHPTEKPMDLYKFLIERYSKVGDRVLDPTFGSGNSGRACAELGRKYIGIEKDNGFFWKYASCKTDSKTNVEEN